MAVRIKPSVMMSKLRVIPQRTYGAFVNQSHHCTVEHYQIQHIYQRDVIIWLNATVDCRSVWMKSHHG